jgi:flagellin
MDASPLDLSSVSSARTALTDLDAQIARISNEISSIGTYQSRLGYAISETRVRADANTEVYARMTSADVASEAADLVRTQILQRSATSVLAQANQLPAVALALLRS